MKKEFDRANEQLNEIREENLRLKLSHTAEIAESKHELKRRNVELEEPVFQRLRLRVFVVDYDVFFGGVLHVYVLDFVLMPVHTLF
jgi:hypothetical protein